MNLPINKQRSGFQYLLFEEYASKTDAVKNLKRIRNENGLFGKRKRFLFESKSESIVFKFGVYEQVINAPIFTANE